MNGNGNPDLMLDVGQANEFKMACRRAGFTNIDIKMLCEGDMLKHVLPVVRKCAEVKLIQYTVDCTANALVPEDTEIMAVEYHNTILGQLDLDVSSIGLHLSNEQQDVDAQAKGMRFIKGDDLRQKIEHKDVLNACVLDYLLAHPEFIPNEWKGMRVFFWGTIYRNSAGSLIVRYLSWNGDKWYWDRRYTTSDWNSGNPAAVLKSN